MAKTRKKKGAAGESKRSAEAKIEGFVGQVVLGDCLDVMRDMEENSVTAIVTDPPYGLEFMGKEWDSFGGGRTSKPGIGERSTEWVSNRGWNEVRCESCGLLVGHGGSPCRCESPKPRRNLQRWAAYQEQMRLVFAEALRVLKPGGHALVFGGTRTYHRLACALEDAGFEIRDCLMWLYGQGFPKSKNIGGGYGTALKPAWEPIILARKPLVGTVVRNCQEHGTGALNIDGCRIGPGHDNGRGRDGEESAERRYHDRGAVNIAATPGPRGGDPTGRWPANVVLDEEAAAMLDEQAPDKGQAASLKTRSADKMSRSAYGKFDGSEDADFAPHDAPGGASRFFYCAKASDRDVLPAEDLPLFGEKHDAERNVHPTVKPVELMRWLVRMVKGPGYNLVLDPFAGSGSTGVACVLEDVPFVLVEREEEYAELARKRVAKARAR